MSDYLERIESPADVRRLSLLELEGLAAQIRRALVDSILVTGGHLGPNLGFVEATIALHHVFDLPNDKLVFDVSHQCYTHKMLTGRKRAYVDPAHYGEFTGFTNPDESEYDLFRAGHTSQAVSLACGLAKARDLLGQHHNVIAVLGDGSLSGGEAFEGLDNAAELGSNLIVVFNDNDRSIAPNSGGVYQNLAMLRKTKGTCEENFFRTLGLDYRYVEEGNDVEALVAAFTEVRDIDHPVVVHIHTRKGKGYAWAEEHPEAAHSIPAGFDPNAAQAPVKAPVTYQQITRDCLKRKMAEDKSVIVVNAGAPSGVGLTPEFRAWCGDQFFDTGITEQHATAFSAGLARGGAKPVFMVMATFAQRAFDQFVQELGLNRSPATVLVFGAGFYDIDATHAGTLDIVMTSNVPGITCLAPATMQEYVDMLEWSIDQRERPVVIRVPEKVLPGGEGAFDPGRPGGWHTERLGSRIAFLSLGSTVELARRAAQLLEERKGISATIIEALNYSSFDEPLLDSLLYDHSLVITLEAGILCGGFGEKVARYYGKSSMRVSCYGGKKEFLDLVPTDEFFKLYHFTPEDIVADIEALLQES
jgi:1-deoxy-D-xylulose-5-phosphate synthase